jgi:gamma-glutamyltranspeptidase/glutathione hydrolase
VSVFGFFHPGPFPSAGAAPRRGLLRLAACLAVAGWAAWTSAPLTAQTPADPEQGGGSRKVVGATARRAMAATANPHATAAALEILRAGGNAVDAAAAAQFVLNVVEPQSSGIGGGGFMLIYLAARKEVVAIDGREEAPAAATPEMFLHSDGHPQPFFPDRITGGNAVGVPGLPRMLEKAVQRYGRVSLARVLAPAIRLAGEGFAVSPRLAGSLKRHGERLGRFPATRALFFGTDGRTLPAGVHLVQPELAATFRLLAAEGSPAFYRGPVARDIVRTVREAPFNPGRMALEDLAGYAAPLRKPVRATFRGYTVYGMGPPSSGGVTLLQMLLLLERAPVPRRTTGAERVHRFAQAARLAYADRARYLADPDFVPVPVRGLLDGAYAARRAGAIEWAAPLAPVEAGRPPGAQAGHGMGRGREHVSTTHLTVVDEARNMVALTSSIEQAFGSGMIVPGRGFLLNNQLTDFSPRPADDSGRPIANRAEGGKRSRRTALDGAGTPGGKRPRSSMAPTLVFRDGKPVLALGSPGGSRIIQYVARVLVDVLEFGRPLQAAIAGPHFTHLADRTALEPAPATAEVVAALERLGHRVRIREQNSGLHAIRIDPESGLLHGGADPRREGTARGY